ncbi:unnamed protein product [Paramecium sonneborni]|uniref:Uncharacterized protein n=1 Tax=Paramecium sonneborni TaxID=65129 RepID=A0A8S1QZS2_9CILI|nr:unnamed protein product [Paramecium sonneborni]
MKPYQTPTSCHSRKGSLKVQRQPLQVISNCLELQQCTNNLQDKIQGLEQRVKNLNSQHAEDRSAVKSKVDILLQPFINEKKKQQYDSKIDSQSYYEAIINKRLENISKIDHSPKHIKTDCAQPIYDKYSIHSQFSKIGQQPSQLHSNSILKIQQLSIKLRDFKMIKDQNQDECAPSLAKIKCFCQEHCNDCFDFYRCTDLVTLKYFIYLLLQEINTLYNSDAIKMADNSIQYQKQIDILKEQLQLQKTDQMTFSNQLKLQKMVGDTQKLIQDIINALQSKQNHSLLINQVEVLNNQMKVLKENLFANQNHTNIQQNQTAQQIPKYDFDTNYQYGINNDSYLIDQSNYQNLSMNDRNQSQLSSKSKSPYQKNQKVLNLHFDSEQQSEFNKRLLDEQTIINKQLMGKLVQLQTEKQLTDSQIIQLENNINEKNKLIQDLENNINSENSVTYKKLNQKIIEINTNLDQMQIQNQKLIYENKYFHDKQEEIMKIEQNYYELQKQNNQQFQQLNALFQENSDLQKLNQQIEVECQEYQEQILKLQEKCQTQNAHLQNLHDAEQLESQIKELQIQYSEQSKIITLITNEAFYLGSMTLYACDIISRQYTESIPIAILMLQKELNQKKDIIQQKMNILQQFGNNMKAQQILPKNNFQVSGNGNFLDNLRSDSSSIKLKNISYYDEISNTVNQNNQQNDLMNMLVVQCNVIEKMMEL